MLAHDLDWGDSLTLEDTQEATELPESSQCNSILTRKLPGPLSDALCRMMCTGHTATADPNAVATGPLL